MGTFRWMDLEEIKGDENVNISYHPDIRLLEG